MSFEKSLLENIFEEVKVNGCHPMEAVRAFGEAEGFSRGECANLFKAFVEFCNKRGG